MLRYALTGTDASSFSLDISNGQLKTSAALDYDTKNSYSVTVSAYDSVSKAGSASISVTINVTEANEAPKFADGTTISNISATKDTAITSVTLPEATDANSGDTITYSLTPALPAGLAFDASTRVLSGTPTAEAASATYTYKASDGTLSATLTFTIEVSASSNQQNPSNNRAPVFAEDASTTRTVDENTASGQNIGSAVSATDANTGDTITYSLSGTDAASFSIVSTSGQLQTSAALDYETKTSYSVTITASDGSLTDTISVTINVNDVNEAPAFASGASISNISATKGTAISSVTLPQATDPDDGNTITYSLTPTPPAGLSFSTSTRALSGTPTAVSASATYTYKASDSNLEASLTFTIAVGAPPNNAPVFSDGTSTTRSIAENTASGQNIGSAVSATDSDTSDTLSYTLGGTDASSFSIVGASGQLQTSAALDYETKSSYSVTVSVSDGNGGSDSITVTINVTDVTENSAPVFTAGDSTTLSIAENTASGQNIGSAVSATDSDTSDTLTYSLGGTDASSFSIVSTSGQLRTSASLDYETKSSYSVTVSVSDGNNGSDSISVTINVTNVNEAPSFADGGSTTRNILEGRPSGTNIGTAVAATDPDGDTLSYTLGGTDASSFSIVSTSGQLRTSAVLDRETKSSYSVTVSASDTNGSSDSISVTINVTNANDAPVFTDGTSTTRSIAENTASGTNIGSAVAAADPDNDALTYTLGGTDASSFSIVRTSGQLRTNAALDYETKSSYSVTVSVSDGNGGSDSITVTISVTDAQENRYPTFTAGSSTTRSIVEGTASGTNIGSAVAATDPDNDALTYTLGGTDASSFSIVSTSGQLRTSASLNYETKSSYRVTVSVSDGKGGSDSITVTINITEERELVTDPTPPGDKFVVGNENRSPVFTAGSSTTRSIAENTASGTNIGSAVAATDPDGDALSYTLSGTDASAFSIVSTSGQLRTSAALDYETKSSYRVTVSVSDGKGGSDSITVTINITEGDKSVTDSTPPLVDDEIVSPEDRDPTPPDANDPPIVTENPLTRLRVGGGGTGTVVVCEDFTLTNTDESQGPLMYWVNADVGALQSLTAPDVIRVAPAVQNATHVAADRADGKIYWTEPTSDSSGTWRIRRANLNGTNIELVKELTSVPQGLALDPSNNKLYLTNNQGKVQRNEP